jgi:hypothetical protein
MPDHRRAVDADRVYRAAREDARQAWAKVADPAMARAHRGPPAEAEDRDADARP